MKKILIVLVALVSLTTSQLQGVFQNKVSSKTETFIRDILKKKKIKNAEKIGIYHMGIDDINACVADYRSLWSTGAWFNVTPWVDNMIQKATHCPSGTFVELYKSWSSPYHVVVTFNCKQALKMIEGIIQHEAGHLHHGHLRTASMGNLVLGTAVSGVQFADGIGTMTNEKSSGVEKADGALQTFFSLGSLIWHGRAWKEGKYKSSCEMEKEADAFVTDDVETLYAFGRFFHLLSLRRQYVDSYDSSDLKMRAWWNKIEPHEYYKKYADWCDHHIFDPHKTHPTLNQRMQAVKERIAKLTGSSVQSIRFDAHPEKYTVSIVMDERYKKKMEKRAQKKKEREEKAQKLKEKKEKQKQEREKRKKEKQEARKQKIEARKKKRK